MFWWRTSRDRVSRRWLNFERCRSVARDNIVAVESKSLLDAFLTSRSASADSTRRSIVSAVAEAKECVRQEETTEAEADNRMANV